MSTDQTFGGRAGCTANGLHWHIKDIAEMPGFNPDGPQNGVRSVTEELVEFGAEPNEPRSIPTVRCVRHGATNCVAILNTGRLYRCPTCNEGAYRL